MVYTGGAGLLGFAIVGVYQLLDCNSTYRDPQTLVTTAVWLRLRRLGPLLFMFFGIWVQVVSQGAFLHGLDDRTFCQEHDLGYDSLTLRVHIPKRKVFAQNHD